MRTSRFDRFVAGDETALSANEQAGLRLFVDKGCAACHSGPAFTDDDFHNLGVPRTGERVASVTVPTCIAVGATCGFPGGATCSPAGSCGTRGGPGQPCCPSNVCSASGTACLETPNGVFACTVCGAMGQPCCQRSAVAAIPRCQGALRCATVTGHRRALRALSAASLRESTCTRPRRSPLGPLGKNPELDR